MSKNASNNITLHNDYLKQDKGDGVITYTIIPEACERLGKKKMSGMPKGMKVHMPTTEEDIKELNDIYIKYAEKAMAKSLGIG